MQCARVDNHRLHCCLSPLRILLSIPFLYTSFSTARLPSVSSRLPFPVLRTCDRLPLSSPFASSSLAASLSTASISSHCSSSSSPSSRFRFLPVLPAPPFPPPIVTFTRGGTANPNDFPTFARSSWLTSKIFLSEYDAYACRYERNPSRAD